MGVIRESSVPPSVRELAERLTDWILPEIASREFRRKRSFRHRSARQTDRWPTAAVVKEGKILLIRNAIYTLRKTGFIRSVPGSPVRYEATGKKPRRCQVGGNAMPLAIFANKGTTKQGG